MGEESLVLKDHAHGALLRSEGEQVASVEEGSALGALEPGEGVDEGALAGAVRADHGNDVTRLRVDVDVEPPGYDESRFEAHAVTSQRSRRATSTPTETSSITRLNASAASASDWRAT